MTTRLQRTVALVLSLSAAALTLAATAPHGIGLSVDSAAYISVARNIAAGKGFVLFDGTPCVEFPPLYPLILAAGEGLSGLDPLEVARWVNALAAALLTALAAVWGWRFGLRGAFAVLPPLSVLVSLPLFQISTMAWSEPVFAVFAFAALLVLCVRLDGGGKRSLALLAALLAGACLTRYAGLLLAASIAATMVLLRRDSLWRRIGDAVALSFAAVLPLALWIVRNIQATGAPFGHRGPAGEGLARNAGYAAHTILSWALPERILTKPLLLGLWLAAVVTALLWGAPELRRRVQVRVSVLPLALVSFGFTTLLVLVASRTAFDRIGDRLLSAVVLPMALTAVGAAFITATSARSRAASSLAVALVSAWLLYGGVSVAGAVRKSVQDGNGFRSREWRESPVMAYVLRSQASHPKPLYSNMPEAIYLLSGIPAKRSPMRGSGSPSVTEGTLVWFDGRREGDVQPVSTLRRSAQLEPLFQGADGAVYRVNPMEGPEERYVRSQDGAGAAPPRIGYTAAP